MRRKQIEHYIDKEYSIYEFEYEEITEDFVKERLFELVNQDIRMNEIAGLSMSIKKKYNLYYLIESNEDDLHYLLSQENENITSTINSSAIFVDPNLIKNRLYDGKFLYGLKEASISLCYDDLLSGYKVDDFEREFNYICLSKANEKICEKHHISMNDKNKKLDLDLYNLSYKRKMIILEPIYEIIIPYQIGRKTENYISIYSLVLNDFRIYSYPYNKEYHEFLKMNKSLLSKINPILDEYYYKDSFEAYLESKKEKSHYRLKQHVKSFSNNENETLRKRYSRVGYFFFNNKRCIPNAIKTSNYINFDEELYNLTLLSKVDPIANIKLAKYAEMHLLSKVTKSKTLEIKFLIEASKFKNREANLLLNKHYSQYAYKNDSLANYYLKASKELS